MRVLAAVSLAVFCLGITRASAQSLPTDNDQWSARCASLVQSGGVPAPDQSGIAPNRFEQIARERSQSGQHFVACNLFFAAAAGFAGAGNSQESQSDISLAKVEQKLALHKKLGFLDKLTRSSEVMDEMSNQAAPASQTEIYAISMMAAPGAPSAPPPGYGASPGNYPPGAASPGQSGAAFAQGQYPAAQPGYQAAQPEYGAPQNQYQQAQPAPPAPPQGYSAPAPSSAYPPPAGPSTPQSYGESGYAPPAQAPQQAGYPPAATGAYPGGAPQPGYPAPQPAAAPPAYPAGYPAPSASYAPPAAAPQFPPTVVQDDAGRTPQASAKGPLNRGIVEQVIHNALYPDSNNTGTSVTSLQFHSVQIAKGRVAHLDLGIPDGVTFYPVLVRFTSTTKIQMDPSAQPLYNVHDITQVYNFFKDDFGNWALKIASSSENRDVTSQHS